MTMQKLGRNGLILGLALMINAVFFIILPWLTQVRESREHPVKVSTPTRVAYADPSVMERDHRRQEESQTRETPVPERLMPEMSLFQEVPRVSHQPELEIDPLELEVRKPDVNPSSIRIDKPRTAAVRQTAAQPQTPELKSGAYALGEVDKRPSLVRRIDPVYPFKARRRNIEGQVMLEFLVNPDGRVEEITVVSAAPQGVFEESAKDAVRKWRFSPGEIRGQAVTTRIRVPIRFRLQR